MARKPKKYHYIYKTTCQVTGKFYVGMHSTDNLEDGYLGSGKILGYSRKKYGDENHVREILEFCSSRDELKQREKEIVNEELLAQPLNINLKYGGEGGWDHQNDGSPKPKAWAASAQARRTSESYKMFHREKMRKIFKKLHAAGKFKYDNFAGKSHTQETKEKMRSSQVGKQSGIRNSQYGTCWVVKDSIPRKIQSCELSQYLELGYSRGRK